MFVTQEPGPSLISVVGALKEDLDQWHRMKLSDTRDLARLHQKFWGKSMAEEERNTQCQVLR